MNPLSGVFGEAWQIYRANARHLISIAFVVYLAAAILDVILSLPGRLVAAFLGLVVSVLAGFLVQAALVKSVEDLRDGRADLTVGQTLSAVTPVLAPVAAASVLAGIAIAIGFILIIVPGLVLITIWAVLVPVIVIEQSGALNAFSRSQQLVRGRGWNVFGTLVIAWFIQVIVTFILRDILGALPVLLAGPLATLIVGSLVAPFIALLVTLMYYRLLNAGPVGGPGQAGPGGGHGQGGYGQQPGGYGDQGFPPGQSGYPPASDYPPPGNNPPGNYPPGNYPPGNYPPGNYPPQG